MDGREREVAALTKQLLLEDARVGGEKLGIGGIFQLGAVMCQQHGLLPMHKQTLQSGR